MGIRAWWELVSTYLRPHRRLAAALGAALFATITLEVVTPQLVRLFIDRAISPVGGSLSWLTAVYVGAVLLQQSCGVVAAWLSETLGWLTTNELRADLMAHCLALDPGFHASHPPGELIERIDGDLNGLSLFFAEFLLNVVGSLLLLVGVLIVVWVQDPRAGAVLSIFAALALAGLVMVRRVAAGAWEQAREASAVLFGYIEERLAGTEDIRSSGAEDYVLRGFYARARDRLWRTSHARVLDAIPWSLNGLITTAANAVAFIVPALLVRRGDITVGSAFVLYFYTQILLQPLAKVSHQVEQLQQAIAGGRRVVVLLGVTSAITDGPGSALPAGALAIGFDAVTFGYGDDPAVLHDITLSVPAGEVMGVVGRTGSGKSSLARLLVGLQEPRTGGVSLGGINLAELTRQQLRSRVALVSQEVHVLQASVRDNLTLFDPDVPDSAVQHAVERLGLGPWLASLPDGLDTVLGTGAVGLSAGESQLLAFGRAFLADPSVIILDEASSRLDPATEVVLEGAVDALLAGRTGVVIAHRLSTLTRCGTVVVLEGGRVVEEGRREDLAGDAGSRFGTLLRTGLDVATG